MRFETFYKDVLSGHFVLSSKYKIETFTGAQSVLEVVSPALQNEDENGRPLEVYHELVHDFALSLLDNLALQDLKAIYRAYFIAIAKRLPSENMSFKADIRVFFNEFFSHNEAVRLYATRSRSIGHGLVLARGEKFYFLKDALQEVVQEITEFQDLVKKCSENIEITAIDSQKGRCMLARRRLLPGETILTEPPLYFFDRQKHERNGYENCSECNAFYVAEFFDDLEDSEPSTFHLLAQAVQSFYYQQELFLHMTEGTPTIHAPLRKTKDTCWKLMKQNYRNALGYKHFERVFNTIVSNSHVGADPPGSGMYPLNSMSNHSCNNSATHWTENGAVNLTCFRTIEQGEEICLSYITDTYRPMNIRKEQMIFRGFECQCDRCCNQHEKVRAFVCLKCNDGPFIPISCQDSCQEFVCLKCHFNCENFREQALQLEKDIKSLHKFHYLQYAEKDAALRAPENLSADKVCALVDDLLECNLYLRGEYDPENIWFYEVAGDARAREAHYDAAKSEYEKAFKLAMLIFGENSKRTAKYKSKMLYPDKPYVENDQKECSIF